MARALMFVVGFSLLEPSRALAQVQIDNRLEWYEAQDQPDLVHMAQADALLVWRSQISPAPDGYSMTTIPWTTYQHSGQSSPLCPTTHFYGQPWTGVGSAILVGDRHVLTAWHLVPYSLPCSETAFVFDFQMKTPDDPQPGDLAVAQDRVFFCESVAGFGSDWSVVTLDRPVPLERLPLKVRRGDIVPAGAPQVNVGHPQRIPLKLQELPTAQELGAYSFLVSGFRVAPGSSGSMLVDRASGKVTGITVSGAGYDLTASGCYTDCTAPGCASGYFTNVLAGAVSFIPRIGVQVDPERFEIAEHLLPEGPLPEPLASYTLSVPGRNRRPAAFRASLAQLGTARGPRFLLNGGTGPVTGKLAPGESAVLEITRDASVPWPGKSVVTFLTVVDETYAATDVRRDRWTLVGGDAPAVLESR